MIRTKSILIISIFLKEYTCRKHTKISLVAPWKGRVVAFFLSFGIYQMFKIEKVFV